MLVATFGPTTGWLGKKITREGDAFVLEDHGSISAGDVMRYDQQGHLDWANDGMRAWVGARVQAPRAVPPRLAPRYSPVPDNALPNNLVFGADDGRTPGPVVASMIGLALVILGLGGAIYFLHFDTSVAVPVTTIGGVSVGGGRVNNIGLMNERRNGILFGFGAAAVGGVLRFVGRKRPLAPPASQPVMAATVVAGQAAACDACNGLVQVGATYCAHCGKPLLWTPVAAQGSTHRNVGTA